ncbi:MAG: IS1634 family transposase [Desulfomonilaceae bacterium]
MKVLVRIANQGSRLSAVRWAQDHCVGELLGLYDFDENDLYEAMDRLAQSQERIEKTLYRAYVNKKGSPNILVLYDVTSSYLEGQLNEFAAYGFNRDKKKGKKQIVIGLLTGADGEPLAVKVFKGNSSDPTTVSDQIETLKKRFSIEEVVFVGDRGMVKSNAKQSLSQDGFKYITALTNPQVRKLLRENIIQLNLFDTTVCEAQHGNTRLILRKNDSVRRKEEKRRQDKILRFQELIQQRNFFVSESTKADPEAGLRKLLDWAGRYKISSFASLSLDGRRLVLTIDEQAKADAALLDGCYVLETDVVVELMDARTIDERYRSLQQVERDFRTLKTGFLEVRPVFVRKKLRTRAHVLIAMLALKIVRDAQEHLKTASVSNENERLSFQDALRTMSRLCLHRYRPRDDVEFLRLPPLDNRQVLICNTLGIRHPSQKQFSVGRRQIKSQ